MAWVNGMMDSEQIRLALACGDFDAAEQLAIDYGASVRSKAQAWENRAVRDSLLREALDTLNECLHLTRVLRAHLATQVRENAVVCQYQAPPAERCGWQHEG
jgi:hypothetical protein